MFFISVFFLQFVAAQKIDFCIKYKRDARIANTSRRRANMFLISSETGVSTLEEQTIGSVKFHKRSSTRN